MEKKLRFKQCFQTLAVGIVLLLSITGVSAGADTPKWDKTFPKSEKVIHEKVSYPNRFGITLSADMYLPKDIDKSKKYSAIIVGTPYGGVKEQGAGIYAQTMAERGFVAIAFDESYNGESGGEPRDVSSPGIFTEDFSAGVDFIGTRPFVDRNRIGVIGLCGSAGFALAATQVDRRIKAIATVSMYDMSRYFRNGWKDGLTDDQRNEMLDKLGEQRWKDFANGKPEVLQIFPSTPQKSIPEGLDSMRSQSFEYYGMRGHHPNTFQNFTRTSAMDFMNFPLLTYIKSISPRPILFVMGENAHSRYFTEDAYNMAAEPKELYIVPEARHYDLYDKTDLIPFDKLTSFFTKHLSSATAMNVGSVQGKASQIVYKAEPQSSFKGSEEFFTGDVQVDRLFPANETAHYSGAYVTFQPGARTAWHLHPAGQHMIVTSGIALTGTRDGDIVRFKTGDTVWCPPDIDHWHGATPDAPMTHLVITGERDGKNVIWKEKVTDAQYRGQQ